MLEDIKSDSVERDVEGISNAEMLAAESEAGATFLDDPIEPGEDQGGMEQVGINAAPDGGAV